MTLDHVQPLAWYPPATLPRAYSPPEAQRFTLDGSPELEERLADLCRQFLAGVRSVVPGPRLEGVALGGGYGRGEGGVLQTAAGDRPYNDLEFYIFVRGNPVWSRHRYGPALHALAESLSHHAGVEVEFKLLPLLRLRWTPASMFYFDLVMGHRWLLGDDRLFEGCDQHRLAKDIPLAEATRLLMNRGTGLLLAWDKLLQYTLSSVEADFIVRNLAKAKLAFGDAVLTAYGQYHWSCLVRAQRLQRLAPDDPPPFLSKIVEWHREGVEFKLHPCPAHAAKPELQAQLKAVTDAARPLWLWLESRRLGRPFRSARGYVLCRLNKCPESSALVNLFRNLRALGPLALTETGLLAHPRQRLYHALALLLWVPSALDDPVLRRGLQRQLGSDAQTFPGFVLDYTHLWRRFS